MDLEALRVAVYRSFADTGRPPEVGGLAERVHAGEDAVVDGLRELARARHVVLGADRIVMAHPFAAIPLGFAVMGTSTLWWGGCAWDSFALPICWGSRVRFWLQPAVPRAGRPTPGT